MTTAEDFLLVMTDPASGKAPISSMAADAVFGGAFLFDLVTGGRLVLDGEGRKARVVVALDSPPDEPLLAGAFERLRTRRPMSPRNAVTRLGKKGRVRTYEALVARGAVRLREEKTMGLFPVTRYEIVDTARRDDLVTRIRASLLHDQPADTETGPVIGLLSAADLTKTLVDKRDRQRAKERATIVAEGDWASEGVRQAIQAAQTAMTVAIIGASVAGTAGSS
jgi:hypothetical protein